MKLALGQVATFPIRRNNGIGIFYHTTLHRFATDKGEKRSSSASSRFCHD
jgi:hypothetical protein